MVFYLINNLINKQWVICSGKRTGLVGSLPVGLYFLQPSWLLSSAISAPTECVPSHDVINMYRTLSVCWSSLRVDYERIKAVGPDRAAAEWLLRCGAKVRFQGFERWHHDYNGLPTGPLGRYKIQAIDATESCIMYRGFDHLGQCYSVENIMFLSHSHLHFPPICSWICFSLK